MIWMATALVLVPCLLARKSVSDRLIAGLGGRRKLWYVSLSVLMISIALMLLARKFSVSWPADLGFLFAGLSMHAVVLLVRKGWDLPWDDL